MDRITESEREVEVYADVDVLVIGGGPAGVSAAIAAARAGATTMLVEHHGFLGGMWTAGMVLTLAGFNSWLRPYRRCVAGVPGEWIERAEAQGGARVNSGFVINTDPEVMKRVADELMLEAGVTCLFHSWGAAPIMEDGRVRGAFIENVDGRRAIRAAVTIDCTGNGDLMARSGAEWVKGQTLQPMTMSFRMGHARPTAEIPHDGDGTVPIGPEGGMLKDPILNDYASVRRDIPFDRDDMIRARDEGEIPTYGGPWFGGMEKDVVWVNSTRIVGDASDATELSRAEMQGRQDTRAIIEYFRNHVPGMEDVDLVQTSTQIGVRETRRLVGEYVLTGDDVRASTTFSDSIAVGCWPIDVHPVEREVGVHAMYVPTPFDIPFRMLVPREVEGLLVAGRCAATDREALGSVRVGATCAAMGHAAGAAGALAARAGVLPRDVDIPELQRLLREQGALTSASEVLQGAI